MTVITLFQLLDDAPHRVIHSDSELLEPRVKQRTSSSNIIPLQSCTSSVWSRLALSHTVWTTLMTGVYYLLRSPEVTQRLLDEVRTVWPVLDRASSYEQIDKLPFLASSFIWQA
jgi:hypothetical protein